MRRMICILAALLISTVSVAYAGEHIGIQGVFPGMPDDRTVTLDIFEQDDGFVTVSSLFPDMAVYADMTECSVYDEIRRLFLIHPDRINETIERAEGLISSWLNNHCLNRDGCVFAGELFEKASAVCSGEFLFSDFVLFAEHSLQAVSADQHGTFMNDVPDIMEFAIQWIHKLFADSQTSVFAGRYDKGQYTTLTFVQQGNVILTLSVHCVSGTEKHIVISYKENERYVFNNLHLSSRPDLFSMSNDIYCSNESSYRNANAGSPILHETVTITDSDGAACRFQYTSEPFNTEEAVVINGIISKDVINAEIIISGNESRIMLVTASRDYDGDITAYHDLKKINAGNKDDLAAFQIEAVKSVLMMMAELIPFLPGDYQQMILLLFQK